MSGKLEDAHLSVSDGLFPGLTDQDGEFFFWKNIDIKLVIVVYKK